MSSLFYELQAQMLDNDPVLVEARFQVEQAAHLGCTSADGGRRRPTYVWELRDPSMIGYPDSVDKGTATKIFATALSMQSGLFIQSPGLVGAMSRLQAEPTQKLPSPRLDMGGYIVTVDEPSFAAAAGGQIKAWTDNGEWGTLMQAALDAYWDAAHTILVRARYLNLYAAFELAVNAVDKDEVKTRFDKKAAEITPYDPELIEDLRNLNSGLKHTTKAVRFAPEMKILGERSRNLKALLDHALADRLGFALPTTYAQWVR